MTPTSTIAPASTIAPWTTGIVIVCVIVILSGLLFGSWFFVYKKRSQENESENLIPLNCL